MAPKTVKQALANMLEDLSQVNLDKFCRQLLDRREEPRVRRAKVEGKTFLDIADVFVTTFTEARAVGVAEELLRQIECNQDADRLVEETRAHTSTSDPSQTPSISAGASGGDNMADDKHFVDKHQVELKKRVTNIRAILDELLDDGVIDQEGYDRISALPTSQDRVRALYSGCLQGGRACKDAFLRSLEKNEVYLIRDLRGNK